MTAFGVEKLEKAKDLADTDPVAAYFLAERLPASFKGTPLAKDAGELLAKLRKDRAVVAELSAIKALEPIRKIDQHLVMKAGADEPMKGDFQKNNATLLRQLKDRVQQMKKSWPDAKATQEAVAVGDRYGVVLK
jgi:hypothetical protein